MMKPRSLYVKFALTTITIMLVSSLLAFMYANFYYQHKLKPSNDEKNTIIALDIANYIEHEQHINLNEYLEHIATIGYQLYLIDHHGNEIFYGDPFRDDTLPNQIKSTVIDGEIYHGIAEFPQETFITGFFANELSNTIGVPLAHNDKKYALFIRPNIKLLFNEMHILFAWLLGLTIILSIIFVLIGAKYLIHPISKLTKATETISEGNFSIKLAIDREDEIGTLAKSFKNMTKQLEKHDEMKSEFISDISHDIQSPLSNIKGYTNLLEKETLTQKEKAHYISIINKETNRLSSLTKQLLLLSSLEQQEGFLKKTIFSLSDQLKEVVYNYQWLINDKGMMVSYSLPDIKIKGDQALLYNVWDNLLTNAIKYNKENGNIHISLIDDEQYIKVQFQDSGIGIDKNIKDRIFDRFYREDSSRTSAIEGTGLGLSIALSVITLHEGSIKVESEKNKGSIFTVFLPKY